MHAGGGTNDRGEKRNVLIVSILLPIGGDLYAVQQYAEARLCPDGGRGTRSAARGLIKPVMSDSEVKDQAPAPGLAPCI